MDGATLRHVGTSGGRPALPPDGVPTLGVEEEFLLTDLRTRAVVPCAPVVIKAARDHLGDRIEAEIFPSVVETRTSPVATLDGLAQELRNLRAGLAAAAAQAGCRAVAAGTAVVPPGGPLEITDKARYLRMAAEYGPLVTGDGGAGVCGCHVHIGVADRAEAVQLCNHLRPWLPALQALSANSPFHGGRDSGYASWRTMRWAQWPGTGPAPLLADAAAYDALLDAMVDSGMMLDRRMVYWYARPSEHFPTVEVRVADVNADPDTVLLLSGLTRALATVLLAGIRRGEPAPDVLDPVLRAAHWRAARDGLRGSGIDPVDGRPRPAVELVDRLVLRATPGLEAAGDLPLVRDLWQRQRKLGCGADRQRAAFRRRGDLRDVVDLLVV
ncbi:glutamate--cysteine ligase [Streptomyces sannanensis]|uniref:Putative glutamate--cysteine ligase 2 n=1 Tax=Streptomyces sannanensis TaxID=285536 RepID=A0ABP6S5I8_9ACTN